MKHQPDNTMADLVRDAFKRSGLTMNQLSRQTGVCYATIHGFMRGERDILLSVLSRMAPTLGVEVRCAASRGKKKGR